jgi:chromosomal replication initiator protein
VFAVARVLAGVAQELFTPLLLHDGAGWDMHKLRRAVANELAGGKPGANTDVLFLDVDKLALRVRTCQRILALADEMEKPGKQIVVASGTDPEGNPTFADWLYWHFGDCRVVDVREPGFTLKLGAIERRAKIEGIRVPEDVSAFIAARIGSNPRKTEGAFVRLIAYTSVTGSPMTLEVARWALRHVV